MNKMRLMLLIIAIVTVISNIFAVRPLSEIYINRLNDSDDVASDGSFATNNVEKYLRDHQCGAVGGIPTVGYPMYPSMKVEGTPDTEDITFKGIFTPLANTTKLALFSDDGCDVTITSRTSNVSEKILSRYRQGQALPSSNSFVKLPFTGGYIKDTQYIIEVKYSNTCYLNDTDIDGCTLVSYQGDGTILPMSIITTNNDKYNILKNSTDNILPVLDNDYHLENKSLFIDTIPTTKTVPTAQHGTLSFISGKLNYVPNANYTGLDNFTYTVYDPDGNAATANVEITVCDSFPGYPIDENNLLMSLYKKSDTLYQNYATGAKAGNNAYIGLTFSIPPGYKFVANQALPKVTVMENDICGKSVELLLAGSTDNPVNWQRKVNNDWIDCSSPINDEFGNKYGFTNAYYRCMLLWDTTYQPTGHNANHTVSMVDNDKIDLTKFLGTDWSQDVPLDNPTSKSIDVANMVITDVSTSNGNVDFIIYDFIGADIISNPKIMFTIKDDGDNTHKYGVIIRLWPTKHRGNFAQNSTDTVDSDVVSELVLKREGLTRNVLTTVSLNDETGLSGWLERGTYTFDIYLYEYDTNIDKYIDWTVFKGLEKRTTKSESVFDCLNVFDKYTDTQGNKHGHDVWIDSTTENGVTTKKLKYYYELTHGDEVGLQIVGCPGAINPNDVTANMYIVDGLLNVGVATKYSLEETVTNKNQVNVMHDGTNHTGITARTIADTDPQDEWRVVFTGTYDCGKYYRRDHLPARMLAANEYFLDVPRVPQCFNLIIASDKILYRDGVGGPETTGYGPEHFETKTVAANNEDDTITAYFNGMDSLRFKNSIIDLIVTSPVRIINNCPLTRTKITTYTDVTTELPAYTPTITFNTYYNTYTHLNPLNDYHTIVVSRYDNTGGINIPDWRGVSDLEDGTFSNPDQIIISYEGIVQSVTDYQVINPGISYTACIKALFENCLLHEIGHCLNIKHSPNSGYDIMPATITNNEWRLMFNRWDNTTSPRKTPWGLVSGNRGLNKSEYYENQRTAQRHMAGL